MKKTIFRTTLLDGSNDLCNTLVLMAAKSNGGAKIALKQLLMLAEANKIQWPALYGDISVEPIGETLLHIDRKFGEGDYRTVCIIQEIEVLDLDLNMQDEEKNDIPLGLYNAAGIGDN